MTTNDTTNANPLVGIHELLPSSRNPRWRVDDRTFDTFEAAGRYALTLTSPRRLFVSIDRVETWAFAVDR